MRTRHLSKALVGLVAVATMIGPLGSPASADTRTATATSGTLDLYRNPPLNLFLGDLGVGTSCGSDPASHVTLSGTSTAGTWSAAVSSDVPHTYGTSDLRVRLDIDVHGTYSGSTLNGTADVIALLETVGSPPCHNLDNEVCVLVARSLSVTGTHTATSPPTIQTGATFTFSGDNAPGSFSPVKTDVLGNGTTCPGNILMVMGSGYVDLDTLVVTV